MIFATYKNQSIEQRSLGADNARFYVLADGFNPDGYATLNNAKGAITKAENAGRKERIGVIVDVLESNGVKAVPQIDTATDGRIDDTVKVLESASVDGWIFGARGPNGDPIHANPGVAHLYAEMDYFGMAKTYDPRSRNKREGGYAGRVCGKHYRKGNRPIDTLKQSAAFYKSIGL